jgi:hypothetical protein
VGDIAEGSILVTDLTLRQVGQILDENSIPAYGVLEDRSGFHTEQTLDEVKTNYGPIVEAIRASGKEPVINPYQFGIHGGFIPNPEEKQSLDQYILEHYGENPYSDTKVAVSIGNGNYGDDEAIQRGMYLIEAVRKTFGVHVILEGFITGKGFSSDIAYGGNLVDALVKMGKTPEKTVVIEDHHASYDTRNHFDEAGFDKVEIALGCPCCRDLGSASYYVGRDGLKFFPLPPRGDNMGVVLDKLVSQIQERAAE